MKIRKCRCITHRKNWTGKARVVTFFKGRSFMIRGDRTATGQDRKGLLAVEAKFFTLTGKKRKVANWTEKKKLDGSDYAAARLEQGLNLRFLFMDWAIKPKLTHSLFLFSFVFFFRFLFLLIPTKKNWLEYFFFWRLVGDEIPSCVFHRFSTSYL
jgi:hypothetical protein